LIAKHVDLIAIGAILFVLGLATHVPRVRVIQFRAPQRILLPGAPDRPIVVIPAIPRVVLSDS
jgi:hypothetical protein